MPRPSVLIFDLGKVLVDYVDLYDSEDFLQKCFVPRAEVEKFFTTEGPFFEFERGRVSGEEFFEAAIMDLDYHGTPDELRVDLFKSMKWAPIKEMSELIYLLKSNHGGDTHLWMLSNLNQWHYEDIHSRWPGIFANFFKVFLSCKMGSRKPEKEIFVRALEEGGAKAENCLFIDDKLVNVNAARELGINSLQFTGFADFKKSLLKFGFTADRVNVRTR